MPYVIQPKIHCENCNKCGSRPVIVQVKSDFSIQCPNKNCNNIVAGPYINIDEWNRVNKK